MQVRKVIEENFPIGKLQAMIDKYILIMKKQIIILLLTLSTASYLYAQDAPCNDAAIMNKGKWIRLKANPEKTNFTKPQELAIAARMEEMYKMMLKAIPVPRGLEEDRK